MTIDLTQYLPKPLEMKAGDWTITSPVPNVATGKIITAFQALQAEQARRAAAGEPILEDADIPGFPDTTEELATLILGESEYQRLVDAGCPYAYIVNAVTAALIYWANGASETAVHLYNQAINGASENVSGSAPKAKTRRPSKNGRPTA